MVPATFIQRLHSQPKRKFQGITLDIDPLIQLKHIHRSFPYVKTLGLTYHTSDEARFNWLVKKARAYDGTVVK